jgi:hypothetical protein
MNNEMEHGEKGALYRSAKTTAGQLTQQPDN